MNVELLGSDIMRWVFGDHMALILGKGQPLHSNDSFSTKGVLALTFRSWKMHAFQNIDFHDLIFWFEHLCFDLILKNLFFSFWKMCTRLQQNLSQLKREKVSLNSVWDVVTRPNLESSVSDGWHSQYPKAFAKIHLGDGGLSLVKKP